MRSVRRPSHARGRCVMRSADHSWREFSTARAILLSVDGRCNVHSLTRTTVQPARRNLLVTRLSRRRFASILSRQNLALLRGKLLQRGHPCQKQPSTNTATLRPGQAKSGRPSTVQCLRYPRNPDAQRSLPSASSVLRFPLDRTAAMFVDLASFETRSIAPSSPKDP